MNVEIDNPLPPTASRSQSQGNQMALNNIRSRLTVLYGARADLSTATRNDQYVTTLKYPITMQLAEA